MTHARALWSALVNDESGQDMIEYALVSALLALGALAGVKTLAAVIAQVPYYLIWKFEAAFSA